MQQQSRNHQRLLTESEAANRLGVRARTLSKWRCLQSEPLAYVRIGGRIRYREQDLIDYIEANVVKSGDSNATD